MKIVLVTGELDGTIDAKILFREITRTLGRSSRYPFPWLHIKTQTHPSRPSFLANDGLRLVRLKHAAFLEASQERSVQSGW